MLVECFLGRDAVIVLAGDDMLCRKRGLRLFGAGMHHDPLSSSRKLKIFSWGHDWVTLCLIVAHPGWAPSKVFALPICMRLPSRDRWAASSSTWTAIEFGLYSAFEFKMRVGLYYKAGRDRPLQFVLSRDTQGQRPTQIYYCTDLSLSPVDILSRYSLRWAIEVTHHDAKQFLGFEDPANRVPRAVECTAPLAMFLYSLTVLWYAQHGHQHLQFPKRSWYPRKSEPSFADMLTPLRRTSWEHQFQAVRKQPTLGNKTIERLTFLATLAG